VSRDLFVVYTSNVFAILGLRALYFVLAGALKSLRYLKWALVGILVLVGVKMLLSELVKIPVGISLGTVAVILGVATVLSLLFPEPPDEGGPEELVHDGSEAASVAEVVEQLVEDDDAEGGPEDDGGAEPPGGAEKG
jgi:tellurite resistance protein TerC